MSGQARPLTNYTYCGDCDKRGYFDRKTARTAARVNHAGDKGVRPYECPAHTGLWHLGHIPERVRTRGIDSASAIADRRRRKRAEREEGT